MARAIDGEALWDKLEDALWYDNYDRDMAEKIVLDMPTLTPPNEPLTLEQLREMDGQPVWIVRLEDNLGWWAIVRLGNDRANTDYGAYFMLSDYGKTWLAYAYQPAHIDREAWAAEWKEYTGTDAGFHYCSKCGRQAFNYEDDREVVEALSDFCHSCGRAMTPEAWAELEKRLRG